MVGLTFSVPNDQNAEERQGWIVYSLASATGTRTVTHARDRLDYQVISSFPVLISSTRRGLVSQSL